MARPEAATASCDVCSAPALALSGACAFCRTPLPVAFQEPAGLLDYLAARLPVAEAGRGLFGRGPVRRLRVEASGERFRARLKGGALRLEPELEAAAWVDRLLAALSRRAASDGDVREAVSRAGWALR